LKKKSWKVGEGTEKPNKGGGTQKDPEGTREKKNSQKKEKKQGSATKKNFWTSFKEPKRKQKKKKLSVRKWGEGHKGTPATQPLQLTVSERKRKGEKT